MSRLSAPYDITIAGGGLAGASLAIMLADHLPRARIALIEATSIQHPDDSIAAPSYDDRSSALSLGSAQILQKMAAGTVWQQLAAGLMPIRHVHVSDRSHPAGVVMDGLDRDQGILGYVVENREFGQALYRQILASTRIHLISPARVEQVFIGPDYAQLKITGEATTLSTRLLVIADGADSALREQLGIAVQRVPYHQSAVIANITTSCFHNHIAYERFTEQGPMALLPLKDFEGEHRSALVWTIDATFSDQAASMTDTVFLQNIQQRFGQRLGFFTKAGKRSIYPLALHTANEQVRHRIVLMGNAAHAMHPVAGQGFNLSMRDCAALSKILQNARHGDFGKLSLLMQYQQRQESDQEKTIVASHLVNQLFSSSSQQTAIIRNGGIVGLNFLPGIKRWFIRQAMGVGHK